MNFTVLGPIFVTFSGLMFLDYSVYTKKSQSNSQEREGYVYSQDTHMHTHTLVFQSEFNQKRQVSCLSLPVGGFFYSYTFPSSVLSLCWDKIQSPARSFTTWPLSTFLPHLLLLHFSLFHASVLLSFLLLNYVKVILLFPLTECPFTIVAQI